MRFFRYLEYHAKLSDAYPTHCHPIYQQNTNFHFDTFFCIIAFWRNQAITTYVVSMECIFIYLCSNKKIS